MTDLLSGKYAGEMLSFSLCNLVTALLTEVSAEHISQNCLLIVPHFARGKALLGLHFGQN